MGQVGFVLSHEQFPANRLVDLAVRAEQAGFDCVWTSDHFHPWMDNEGHSNQAWVTLAAISQRTNLPFGTGVTCPTYRYHPAIVAQAFASLATLAPGRVFLGVGSGEAVNEEAATGQWGDYTERADRLREAISLIRGLWTGDWLQHEGRYYRTRQVRLYDPPPEPIPLYVAAGGPDSAQLSGEMGDGLITDAMRAVQPEMRDAWEAGARGAGRDPAQMPVLAEAFLVVGGEVERRESIDKWRFLPHSWDRFVEEPDPRAIRDGAASVPAEQVAKGWVVSEDPEDHAKELIRLFERGVTQVFVHTGQSDQERFIDFYGRRVLPMVREMSPEERVPAGVAGPGSR